MRDRRPRYVPAFSANACWLPGPLWPSVCGYKDAADLSQSQRKVTLFKKHHRARKIGLHTNCPIPTENLCFVIYLYEYLHRLEGQKSFSSQSSNSYFLKKCVSPKPVCVLMVIPIY